MSIACVGLGTATAAQAVKLAPGFAASKDPRSGAALNREAALSKAHALPPMFPDSPFMRIHTSAVNDPTTDATAQDTQSETSIAAVGTSGIAVAYNDSGSYNGSNNHFTGGATSTTGGLGFNDFGALPASTEGDAGDPVLATQTSTGNVFQATLGFATGENVQVFKSTDGGQTYGAPVNGTPGYTGSGEFQDKSWITADNNVGAGQNNLYLCWTRFGAAEEVRLTRSTDNGATFGPSLGTLISSGGQGCYVLVGPDHALYVFYYRGTGADGQGGDNKLFVRKSTDQGVTFAAEVQVADLTTTTSNGDLQLNGGVRSNSFPHATISPSGSQIIVVFNDDPSLANTADNGDVYYVRSFDGGSTWGGRVRFNDDTAGDQFMPTVAVTPNGSSYMFGYYSRKDDASNLMFHRRGRVSDNALTLSPSFQLGPNTPLVLGQDPVINATYMGDYDQIAAVSDSSAFLSSWADNRAGNTFHARQPDVRFARINLPRTSPDVSVSVSASPANINLGENTTISVNVSSSGATASDVYLNLAKVTGLAFKSVNSVGAQCDVINQFAGCSLGQIPAGATKSVQIVATGSGGAATRTLSASATTSSKDTNTANNTGSGSVVVATGSATAGGYSTGTIATPINDLSTVDIPLTVPSEGTIVRVYPSVRLNHTFDSDVELYLISPTGKIVELSTGNGGAGDNYGTGANDCTGTKTLFDDFQATSIVNGVAPFAGGFKPEGSLADLVGEPTDGVWKLRVRDTAGADTGTVGCFSLGYTRVP